MTLCCTALVASLALAGCGSASDVSSADPGAVTRVRADYYASLWGVSVGIRVAFARSLTVTGARMIWEGGHYDVAPYPLDGSDPDVPLESIDLPGGTGVLLEGSVLAACPDAPSPPVFEVDTVTHGDKDTVRYTPDDPALFENAFAQWCAVPVSMSVAGSTLTPEGEITVRSRFHNPGPTSVSVVSEAVPEGVTTWEASALDVPPGSIKIMTVHGHGPQDCAGPTPWETGHVLAEGRPVKPDVGYDEWC